ncbi:Fic family protein [Baekduia sp.]|uniref:Fic family protein n=1 Tax=Baekduia sp. TaxID=2600305 RepID=UPI002DFF8BEF|nr:Fic family protein [Baekduia sp.]
MPTPWEEPVESRPLIEANTRRVVTAIAAQADARQPPTVAMAQQCHRELYEGVPRPFDYYAGEVRDSDNRFPDLIDYEVMVGFAPGVPAKAVPAELNRFEGAAQLGAERLDASISAGATAQDLDTTQLHGVLLYCANLHGLWVRIHPFANGNGRTARLWVVWAGLRYGLPPFIRIKPRPEGSPYAAAAAAAMYGDYDVMVPVLDQMLRSYLAGI